MGSTGWGVGGLSCPLVPSVRRIWIPSSGPNLPLAPKIVHVILGPSSWVRHPGSVQERKEEPAGGLQLSRPASAVGALGMVRRAEVLR